jgi:hypothetical protein
VFPQQSVLPCQDFEDYDAPNGLIGSLYVGTNRNVRLRISDNTTISNLYIAGSGKLTIYMAGASFALTGTTTVQSGNPTNFCYLGLPGNTTVQIPPEQGGTNNPYFYGMIYAPAASLAWVDHGYNYNSDMHLVGAYVAKSINLIGWASFHFDENLLRVGPRRGYLVTTWREP